MYGILGEDESDTKTLKVIVRRLARNPSLTVKITSYGGCGELLKNGCRDLHLLARIGCQRFIICHDADDSDPIPNYNKVFNRIVKPSGFADASCILIPVQELEAWLLADIKEVTHLFSSWKPKALPKPPESYASPKEHLEQLSKDRTGKSRYIHAIHNEILAKHICLVRVARLCKSFRPLADFVASNG